MPLRAFAHALPSVSHTSEDIARMTGADQAFIENKIGIRTRYVLGPDETGISLSQKACEKLFAAHPGLRDRVSLLVTVTQTPDHPIPHNSAVLASRLGLSRSTASFDIALGCSGYLYGVIATHSFLKATGGTDAVLVTCDPYSRIMDPADKNTSAVFGDVATATWITADNGRCSILATDFGTDGSQGDAIKVKAGGAALPLLDGTGEPVLYTKEDLKLHMHGRLVFNFVNTEIPLSIQRCIGKIPLSLEAIDWFALHQGSIYMLDAMAKRVGIDRGKVLKNMSNYGNTVSSTIPLLLEQAEATGKLENTIVLASGFGVGLSWATAVLKFDG